MPKLNLNITGPEYDLLRAALREGAEARAVIVNRINDEAPIAGGTEAQRKERDKARGECLALQGILGKVEAD